MYGLWVSRRCGGGEEKGKEVGILGIAHRVGVFDAKFGEGNLDFFFGNFVALVEVSFLPFSFLKLFG